MEAMGCSECQQIFAVSSDGLAIEQVATTYPYRNRWHWLGTGWRSANVEDRQQMVLSRSAVMSTIGLGAGAVLAGLLGFALWWIFALAIVLGGSMWLRLVLLARED